MRLASLTVEAKSLIDDGASLAHQAPGVMDQARRLMHDAERPADEAQGVNGRTRTAHAAHQNVDKRP